ncbi:type IV conjugative transfer system coupling protein TraD [Hyphococcus luteus]|uniref:Conjugative coupling factor TraD, PFGI-1 class n=1 Tax=Hyphococcus luteus TaxID=2058213 RepID=A0A2S7K0B5_9PROT|nr:type IV conjugative transfer system coupling protein TraD [Marinicaulis flavus]PQA85916.1 conjugative coupling factor TraD, PFGI-1 class [Marinicaulis flavus]
MSDKYQVEALLRPPVELWSALISFCVAAVAAIAPGLTLMPPKVAYGASAAILLLVTIPRLREGWRIVTYHRHLKRLPRYALPADRIPVSNRKLFLGRGFQWEQKHTQRLRDTLRPEAQAYVRPGPLYRWARKAEVAWEHAPSLSLIAGFLSRDAWWNPLRPLPPVGGNPAIHAIEPREQSAFMDLRERVGHTLVLGTTRVGKTRLAETLITQDIRRGDVVITFDPKGDADLLKRMYAEAVAAGREERFYLFHLGFPAQSARYNAIGSFSRITEVATRIAGQLPNEGNAAAFREFAWRFTNIIARALVALGRRPDYKQIRQYINNIEGLFIEYANVYLREHGEAGWSQAIETIRNNIDERHLPFAMKGRNHEAIALFKYTAKKNDYDPVLDGLKSAWQYDRTYFDKIVSSLGPLMEKLTSGQVAELLSPDYCNLNDDRPILDWRQVIREKGIVYVGLDALSDFTVSSAVGNSMFADLVSVAGEIYKHGIEDGLATSDSAAVKVKQPINIHADEFNELIGDEFIPLVNKAGGAGVQVTAYTQTWSDIEARVRSRAKAGQITGNFNTLIMLRVKEQATAELLTNQLSEVEIQQMMSVSGVNDSSAPDSSSHFTSRNEDRVTTMRVPMVTPSQLIQLPKGQAFALLEGGTLWKLRLPLPVEPRNESLPDGVEGIAEAMRERYVTNDLWFRTEEPWWRRAASIANAGGAPVNITEEDAALDVAVDEIATPSPPVGFLEAANAASED